MKSPKTSPKTGSIRPELIQFETVSAFLQCIKDDDDDLRRFNYGFEDYYNALGRPHTASSQEIRQTRLKLIQELHPDEVKVRRAR